MSPLSIKGVPNTGKKAVSVSSEVNRTGKLILNYVCLAYLYLHVIRSAVAMQCLHEIDTNKRTAILLQHNTGRKISVLYSKISAEMAV